LPAGINACEHCLSEASLRAQSLFASSTSGLTKQETVIFNCFLCLLSFAEKESEAGLECNSIKNKNLLVSLAKASE